MCVYVGVDERVHNHISIHVTLLGTYHIAPCPWALGSYGTGVVGFGLRFDTRFPFPPSILFGLSIEWWWSGTLGRGLCHKSDGIDLCRLVGPIE